MRCDAHALQSNWQRAAWRCWRRRCCSTRRDADADAIVDVVSPFKGAPAELVDARQLGLDGLSLRSERRQLDAREQEAHQSLGLQRLRAIDQHGVR